MRETTPEMKRPPPAANLINRCRPPDIFKSYLLQQGRLGTLVCSTIRSLLASLFGIDLVSSPIRVISVLGNITNGQTSGFKDGHLELREDPCNTEPLSTGYLPNSGSTPLPSSKQTLWGTYFSPKMRIF